MVGGAGGGWKKAGMVVLIVALAAAVVAAAFFIGRGCDDEDKQDRTTTTRTQPVETTAAPVEEIPEEPAVAPDPVADEPTPPTETTGTTERYVTGEGEGSTPCVGGFQTTTRTTYYSDGSTDTVTITEPCTP